MSRDVVYIVDDDAAVRDSIAALLSLHGYTVQQFASARDYLAGIELLPRGCVLLDIRMPGMSGLELQDELNRCGRTEPIVFITGHGDIELAVRAMKAGARDFLQKPFDEAALLRAIDEAQATNRIAREPARDPAAQASLAALTWREREILAHVLRGLTSKEIGQALGISVRTVDIHRGNIMNKTGTRNVVELVLLAMSGGFAAETGTK
jgi:two-component system, LuxR family, response regulator FixJ